MSKLLDILGNTSDTLSDIYSDWKNAGNDDTEKEQVNITSSQTGIQKYIPLLIVGFIIMSIFKR